MENAHLIGIIHVKCRKLCLLDKFAKVACYNSVAVAEHISLKPKIKKDRERISGKHFSVSYTIMQSPIISVHNQSSSISLKFCLHVSVVALISDTQYLGTWLTTFGYIMSSTF